MSPRGRLVSKAAETEGRGKARRARRRASVRGRYADFRRTSMGRGGRSQGRIAPKREARKVVQ
jgi:hypothetical protein